MIQILVEKFFIAFLESRDFNSCKKRIKNFWTRFSLYDVIMAPDLKILRPKIFWPKKFFFKVFKWFNSKSYHVKKEIWRPSWKSFLYQGHSGSTLNPFHFNSISSTIQGHSLSSGVQGSSLVFKTFFNYGELEHPDWSVWKYCVSKLVKNDQISINNSISKLYFSKCL